MSEKRFTLETISYSYFIKDNQKGNSYYNDLRLICDLLNEQQDKITELEKNFDDLVEWASEIAKRNVVLGEENASLKQRIRDIKYNNCD